LDACPPDQIIEVEVLTLGPAAMVKSASPDRSGSSIGPGLPPRTSMVRLTESPSPIRDASVWASTVVSSPGAAGDGKGEPASGRTSAATIRRKRPARDPLTSPSPDGGREAAP